MTSREELELILDKTLTTFDLPELGAKHTGKVRDMYKQARGGNNELILVTTDRLSAFDRILGAVPYKGQILNDLSLFWFEQVKDIVPNYVITAPHPHVIVGHDCQALSIEVIVRGFISGVTKTALWYQYSQGNRHIYGYDFPEGLVKNQALPEPIITPTTKGGATGHDERLTCAEVVTGGYLDADLWQKVQDTAIKMFKKGQEVAANAGLILVDTKYEFGLLDGELLVIDEMHTPDSSRYWNKATYESLLAEGKEPENMDKEFIRLWYAARDYRGDGEPPAFSKDLSMQASLRYQDVLERLTSKAFEPVVYPAENDIREALTGIYL